MNTTVEDKIIDILFKDMIIADVLVDNLLPEVYFCPEAIDDLTVKDGYTMARKDLKKNIEKLIR